MNLITVLSVLSYNSILRVSPPVARVKINFSVNLIKRDKIVLNSSGIGQTCGSQSLILARARIPNEWRAAAGNFGSSARHTENWFY